MCGVAHGVGMLDIFNEVNKRIMKNLFTKIALVMILGLFTLWYFTNQSRIKHKENAKNLTEQVSYLTKSLESLTEDYEALKISKSKVDTVILTKPGKTKIVYIEKKDTLKTQILTDSLIADDLKLNYTAEYIGKIYSIDFDYVVTNKIITVQNIVKVPEPYEVKVNVPINVRSIYIGGSISTANGFSPYIGILYTDKQKRAFAISYDPINKSYQGGFYYKLF